MAVTYLTLYLAGQALQVVEGSQYHHILAAMGATASPPVPGPPKRPDPFPQYVHDDEVAALLASATDPAVASLVNDSGSATSGALGAAFATRANPSFTGTVGLPGGTAGDKRLPVNGAATIDGSTLPAGTSDKVAYALSAVFKGGFTAEAGYGQVNPHFVFGHNLFTVTGKNAGDMDGINDYYGTLAENHLYAPGATLFKQIGMQSETAVEASAVGSTVASLMSHWVKGPAVNAGTVVEAVSLRFDQPTTSGAGAITGLNVGLWGRGAALFEGLTPNSQTSRKGVWIGGGAASGGEPAVELSTGTDSWRIDNVASELRFLKAGVAQVLGLDFNGNLTFKQLGPGQSQITARTLLVTADASKTSQGRLTVYANAAASTPVYVQGIVGQTADLQRWQNSNGQPVARVHADGALITKQNTAPADADLAAGEMALWFDSTNGAAKLMVKSKDVGGTVRTGQVALA